MTRLQKPIVKQFMYEADAWDYYRKVAHLCDKEPFFGGWTRLYHVVITMEW